MVIFGFTLTAGIIAAFFGGVSGVCSTISLFRQLRSVDNIDRFRESLNELRKTEYGKALPDEKKSKQFEEFLYYGPLFAEELKSHIKYRFLFVLFLIASSSVFIPINLNGIELFIKKFEVHDILIIVTQILISSKTFMGELLRVEEKKFLKNLSMIQNYYYHSYIRVAIIKFNNIIEDSDLIEHLRARNKEEEERTKRIINENILKLVRFIKKRNENKTHRNQK
jgi:hypothetical protein